MRLSVFLFVFISLSIIICEEENKFKIDLKAEYNPKEDIKKFSPEMILYYSKLLGISYCHEEDINKGICCDDELKNKNWKRLSKLEFSEEHKALLTRKIGDIYNFQILLSESYKKILILFPGNREIFSQIFKEAERIGLIKTKVKNGLKIMGYVGDVYRYTSKMFYKEIKRIIDLKEEYKNYQIIFSGHSLGGMLASVFAFDSIEKKAIDKEKNNPVLISLGAPKTGNFVFVQTVKEDIPNIFRIMREGDLFPKIPSKSTEKIDLKEIEEAAMILSLLGDFSIQNSEYEDFDKFYVLDKNMEYIYECDQEYKFPICRNPYNIKTDLDLNKHFYYFFSDTKISNLCLKEENQTETENKSENKTEKTKEKEEEKKKEKDKRKIEF